MSYRRLIYRNCRNVGEAGYCTLRTFRVEQCQGEMRRDGDSVTCADCCFKLGKGKACLILDNAQVCAVKTHLFVVNCKLLVSIDLLKYVKTYTVGYSVKD